MDYIQSVREFFSVYDAKLWYGISVLDPGAVPGSSTRIRYRVTQD